MDIADAKGPDFLRLLRSAERFSDFAISCGLSFLKTPSSRSRALLVSITLFDQRFPAFRSMAFYSLWVRVLAAFLAASDRPRGPLVRAAFRAAAERSSGVL